MVAQPHARNAAAALCVAAALLTSSARAGAATDPCTLLSAIEAQSYVGPLSNPPFRADDTGTANTHGTSCVYRGSGGKQISLDWRDPYEAWSVFFLPSVMRRSA